MPDFYATMENFKDARNRLAVILNQLADVAHDRGDIISDPQSAAAKLSNKPSEFQRPLSEMLKERSESVVNKTAFRLAVVGEFNTGKSSLINALLGREVLSTSRQPRTAAKTVLRYGERDAYRVVYRDPNDPRTMLEPETTDNLAEDIADVTSDDAHVLLKGERETVATQVKEVEVWCNSEFLNREETEIIDTPGLGSVFEEHKTVTYSLIPSVDATLVLIPSDPGFGSDEENLLAFIQQHINQLLFVMTKVDYLSSEEQQVQIRFTKDTIESIVKIPVDRVYGVSARWEVEGEHHRSGFGEFLEALEAFFVSSSGVTRLTVPLGTAQTCCEVLIKNTQKDLDRANQDVETLRDELERLLKAQIEIEEGRRQLIETVETRLEEMSDNALSGIDALPTQVEKAVMAALDDFNKESLKEEKVKEKLQPIIRGVIDQWVQKKDQSFATQAKNLQDTVDKELRRFVKLVDTATNLKLSGGQAQKASDMDLSVISGEKMKTIVNTTVKAGGAVVMGLGGTALALMVPSLAAIVLPLLFTAPYLLLVPALIPIAGQIFKSEERMREKIKKQLQEPIPGNNINFFSTLVEGYVDQNNQRQVGLRENLSSHFEDWGSNLKTEINTFVANLVNTQLNQLTQQITEREENRFDREARLEMYLSHLATLHQAQTRLNDLIEMIDAMRNDKPTEQTSI
jgi:GTPase Era involved in 16S rRNA processing